MNQTKVTNFWKALMITIVFSCVLLLVFYPSNSPLGKPFDLFVIMIAVHYLAIAYGAAVFLLRIFRVLKNYSLLYILAGTLNLFIYAIGVVLYFQDLANPAWLNKVIANLFIGLLIIVDFSFFTYETKPRK